MMPGIEMGPMIAPTILSELSYSHTASYASSVIATTYNLGALSIGTADVNRIVIVSLGSLTNGAASRSVSSVTIGGVSATIVANNPSPAVTYSTTASFAYASVPTGSTASIVVNYTGNMGAFTAAVYKVVSNIGNTITVTNSYTDRATANGDTSIMSTVMGTANNGVLLAVSQQRNGLVASGAAGLTEHLEIDALTGEWGSHYGRTTDGTNMSAQITTSETSILQNEFCGSAISIEA